MVLVAHPKLQKRVTRLLCTMVIVQNNAPSAFLFFFIKKKHTFRTTFLCMCKVLNEKKNIAVVFGQPVIQHHLFVPKCLLCRLDQPTSVPIHHRPSEACVVRFVNIHDMSSCRFTKMIPLLCIEHSIHIYTLGDSCILESQFGDC